MLTRRGILGAYFSALFYKMVILYSPIFMCCIQIFVPKWLISTAQIFFKDLQLKIFSRLKNGKILSRNGVQGLTALWRFPPATY